MTENAGDEGSVHVERLADGLYSLLVLVVFVMFSSVVWLPMVMIGVDVSEEYGVPFWHVLGAEVLVVVGAVVVVYVVGYLVNEVPPKVEEWRGP